MCGDKRSSFMPVDYSGKKLGLLEAAKGTTIF